ncbi:MAG TPA: exodeoxyribonuclease VII large subunit, partial [Anaeromyxobacteraceae bacterium]|nr:exodeoxyribonuclease VII large subunit [Anaeromyxobacteraceae bacterium]
EAARRRLDGWRAATFRREELRLERLGARLEPANVAKLLRRGFALALADGRLVTRSGDVEPGDALRVALGEGWLDATVTARDAGDDPVPGRGQDGADPPRSPAGSSIASPRRRG